MVCFSELEFIPQSQRQPYMILKIAVGALFLLLAWVIYKNSVNRFSSASYVVLITVYTCISSFYRGYYFVALFEALIVFVMTFPLSTRQLWLSLILSMSTYAGFFFMRWPQVPENSQILSAPDHITIFIQQFVIVALLYHLFVRSKERQLQQEKRFSALGREAARVAHDLKGMMTAPLIYLENIETATSMAGTGLQGARELAQVRTQISRIQDSLSELARLCASTALPQTRFLFSEALKASELLYSKNLQQIHVQLTGDLTLTCNRALISSILSNLISNSISAFRQTKKSGGLISITADPGQATILYTDNAGGFSKEALENINTSQAYSTSGSGMGLTIVRENIEALGAQIEFANHAQGVKIKMNFADSNFTNESR
jgi:signal transduction histidine kinase